MPRTSAKLFLRDWFPRQARHCGELYEHAGEQADEMETIMGLILYLG